MFKLNAVWPNWNWKEIETLVSKLKPEIAGLFVDRIIVPARPEFPNGYLKGEWIVRLTSPRTEKALLFSTRARHPYIGLFDNKGPQASNEATRSPFDLALGKHLKGLKLLSVGSVSRERCVIFDFQDDLRLVLLMIPALPEALLVKKTNAAVWPVIARSRTLRDTPSETPSFTPPDGLRAPPDMPVRPEISDQKRVLRDIQDYLDQEAFSLRLEASAKKIRDLMKIARDRIRQSEVAMKEAAGEADWQRYGDLLKANMGILQVAGNSQSTREVLDFSTDEKVLIPCDPKLDLKRQVEKFYSLAQRKTRRSSEASNRIETFSSALQKLTANQETLVEIQEDFQKTDLTDWARLEKIDSKATNAEGSGKAKRKGFSWLGKTFVSKDDWAIWVGRTKDENLELTFKHARGNDIWMHLRGRPGAHLVIPVQPGKSVPLETLLDAANLALHYSGGASWGKTEVDYALKKYVKRIKDSSEASYTHNKTLIVAPDPVRLKRLLGQQE